MSAERKKSPGLHDLQPPIVGFGISRRIAFAFAVMFGLFAALGGWAAIAEMQGAVISPGLVVVDQHVKKVQHRDGGIVAKLFVKDGSRVEAGDVLVRLDDTQIKAEFGIIRSQLLEMRARRVRLEAESRAADSIAFPAELQADDAARAVTAEQKRLFEDNRRVRAAQIDQLRQRIGQFEEEAKGIAAQHEAKGVELKLIRKELEKIRDLERRKLTPATRVYSMEREEARIAGEHGSLTAQGARVAGQINEIRIQMLVVEQTARTEAQKELTQVDARLSELGQREIAALDKLARTDIRSPLSGIVHELAVHTVGGVLSPAEPVMLIVPERGALTVELRIAPTDIDQVHINQDVWLKFTSFNQRTTPEVAGRITFVSADISRDPKGRTDYFIARASIDGNLSSVIPGKTVVPGMPVEAFLVTARRTALTYLTKPIVDQFSRTFREQ